MQSHWQNRPRLEKASFGQTAFRCALLLAAWTFGLAAAAAATATNDAGPYLAAVRQFADQVLAQGRDVYGRPTPLFVDGLNVDTGEPVKWKWADGKEWVLCNLANQQGLFRALDGLSQLTGEPRYKAAAVEAIRYAFDHLRYGTQNNGGLLAWGGHLAYNATDDVLAGNPGGTGRIHELKCFFPHYQLMWEANPKVTQELIENIWNGHVMDWAILDFNRHGSPNKRGRLWRSEYRGGPVFFWGKGLTFHNAGNDFYYAAGMLSKLAGTPELHASRIAAFPKWILRNSCLVCRSWWGVASQGGPACHRRAVPPSTLAPLPTQPPMSRAQPTSSTGLLLRLVKRPSGFGCWRRRRLLSK